MMRSIISKTLHKFASKSFYKLLKGFENTKLRQKLGMIDYPYPEAMYIAYSLTAIFFAFFISFSLCIVTFIFLVKNTILLFIPFIVAVSVSIIAVIWPDFDLGRKKKNIEASLPLAILTMSTVTQAGAPPQYMFQVLANSEEYPRLKHECRKIERFMNQLGLSFTKAIDKMAEITPSPSFKTFLKELNTTVKSGGDLREFMSKRADDAYFRYRLMLERASDRAETMGEIYTILMIAAPLFIFFTIMMLNFFSAGKMFGLTVDEILFYGVVFGMPIANIIFMFVMYMMSEE
ncbi:MAG: type II secretion system F family protein [Candidatus Diapherotrites archaeon]|nr:type II secretion system F family protein [Candidatus Diapherotrites archaeon]